MKKISIKSLACFMAILMVFSSIGYTVFSVFATEDQSNEITVNFTAYDPNSGFMALNESITVKEGTAAKYGLENAAPGTIVGGNDHGVAEGQITALDALIAMHEIKYGEAFTKDTMSNYFGGSSSYISRMFGKSGGISFAVNDKLPMGDKSDGYAVNECVLGSGDSIYFFIMLDAFWGDYYAYFDKADVNIYVDSEFTLNLKAFQAMETMWLAPGDPTPEGYSTLTAVPDADICLVDKTTGEVGEPVALTDENGNASVSFSETGTYYLTAIGMVEGDYDDAPITAPVCTVTVSECAVDETVKSQWKNFRNSDVNMGITSAKTPVSPQATEKKWANKLGAGWAAAPSVQIIVDDSLIVMSGNTLYKLSLEDGSITATETMAGSPSFGYTPPTYACGMIFVPLGGGTVQAFNAKTLESLWIYKDSLGGQALSPITYSDGCVYTGFWNGENKNANYVCIDIKDETPDPNESKTAVWTMTVMGGFYWAGSVSVGDALVFGTDDGATGWNSPSHLYSVNKHTGEIISCLDIIGDQRSSIAYDSARGRVYFTTKCGYLYSAEVNAQTGELSSLKGVDFGAQSTATPIVYGDKVYFGTGSGISTSGSSGNFVVADAESLEFLYAVGLLGYPQSSLLLSTAYYETEGLLYFYSTYNMTPGGISLIKVNPEINTADGATLVELYDAAGYSQYCIASIICDENGTLYYKNDSANVIAVGKTEAYLTSLSADSGKIFPEFSGEKTDYELVVPKGTQNITLACTIPENANVTYNGTENPTVALDNGTATIEITVTKGEYTRKYNVSVREISGDSSLELLKVNEGNSYSSTAKPLTPEFDAEVMNYAALSLSTSRYFVNVWPVASDCNASVKVYALYGVDEYETGEEIEITAQNSGHNRYAVYYAEDCTTCAVEIVVTAENGIDTTTYTLVLTKEDNTDGAELNIAKAEAVIELNGYKDASDYREEQQSELAVAISEGKNAIESAESVEEVANALTASKAAIDSIKTDAQIASEEELTKAKEQAKSELENYKNASDYREEQQSELAVAISEGKNAIESAESVESVANALAASKSVIDSIKTDEQLTKEETATDIILDKTEITLGYKGTDTITAVVIPETAKTGKIIWTSSNESVATVDENGNIKAVKKGTAVITASTEDGELAATCTVNVKYTVFDVIVAVLKSIADKIISIFKK